MKKYFVAYRFSGESLEVLQERLSLVVEALRVAGIDAYCNLFDQHDHDRENLTPKQIIEKAFMQIDASDGLFVLIASNDKSEGQLIEIGYALAKDKPIIAAIQQNVVTTIDGYADQVIKWQDLSHLDAKLKEL